MSNTSVKFSTPEKKVKLFTSLNKTSFSELTQSQLIDLRDSIQNLLSYECDENRSEEEKENYDAVYGALFKLSDSSLFKPMDQRSLPEFARDTLIGLVSASSIKVINENAYEVLFDAYTADGTMTYNKHQSLNYIHAFWDDFLEEDVEIWESKQIFDNPERFLLDQVYYMARKVILVLLQENNVEEMSVEDFFTALNNISAEELGKLIY